MFYELEQSDESLPACTSSGRSTHSGLALVGLLLSRTTMKKQLSNIPLLNGIEPNISNGDVATSYIGLLCQGKSDFDHIEAFREVPFFKQSLGLSNTEPYYFSFKACIPCKELQA